MKQKLPIVLIIFGIFFLIVFALGTPSQKPKGKDLIVPSTSTSLVITTPKPNNLKVSLPPTSLNTSTPAPDISLTKMMATLDKIDEFGGEGQNPIIDLQININSKKCIKIKKEILIDIVIRNKTTKEVILPNSFSISSMRLSLEDMLNLFLYDRDKKLLVSSLEFAGIDNRFAISAGVVKITPLSTYKLSIPFSFEEDYYYHPVNYFPEATKIPSLIGQFFIKLVYRNYRDLIGDRSVWTGETISNTVPICFTK
jgi:hypothetical protein